MVKLTSRGDLDIVELIFYAPAFLLSLPLLFKHGASRKSGWFFITLLSVLRIVGASCSLYSNVNNDYSAGLLETAAITSAVGTAPLLLALLGFIHRVHEVTARTSPSTRTTPDRVFTVIQLVALAALILAIVGGVDLSEPGSSSYNTGRDCLEAGAILFLIIYLAICVVLVFTVTIYHSVPKLEHKLVIAAGLALPFLLVRVIYTVAVAFGKEGGHFYFKAPSVWVQAFMQFLMEAIVLVLYIWAGYFTPRKPLEEMGPRPEVMRSGDQRGAYALQQQKHLYRQPQPQQQV